MAQDAADFDPGFVLDEASGLYFHASSGFYHDASAGWYYNTNDGVYYKYEEGTYVPITAMSNSGSVVPEFESSEKDSTTESTDFEVKEPGVSTSEESGLSNSVGDVPHEPLVQSRSPDGGELLQGDAPNGTGPDPQADIGSLEVEFPLWYFDSLRSIYWYYDKDSRAYYKYNEGAYNTLGETTGEGETVANIELPQQEQIFVQESGGQKNRLGLQESNQREENEDYSKPMSGWIEETLIDLYLRGYPNECIEDDGPWITSADIFSDDLPQKGFPETSYNRNSLWVTDKSSYGNLSHDGSVLQASVEESDEGSEELEEGEWVPDEPLQIVDGNLFIEGDRTVEERMDKDTAATRYLAEPYVDNGDYYGDLEDGELEDGEIEDDEVDETSNATGEQGTEGQEDNHADSGQNIEEEQWQAQFGQVVREKAKEYHIPGVIDLWDWMIVEMEPNSLKLGKVLKKLVGRITSSVTKLVSASGGLIRTSAIRAAELDFVKVSSGKIYKLRRPSNKHLSSVGAYDSSNPTKDWGYPALGLSLLETSENPSSEIVATDEIERRANSLVSKPFVPNTGHWKFQGLVSSKKKKGRGIPAALLATKYLSPEEILLNEQRKQKYRDRAAERRNLHGGFGIGPGQKGLTPQDQEKVDAENAAGMEGALRRASLAPALGRDNVGKRMLEGMGWKEGQTLGVEGGLVAPIEAQGNDGRAGLGWR
ncbi:unnamed protein product [Calypogeia fissa]